VVLTTGVLDQGLHRLVVSNVRDRAWPSNTIAADGEVGFSMTATALGVDFETADTTGWTVVEEGNTSGPSVWTVIGGRFVHGSDIHGPDSSALALRKGTSAYWYEPTSRFWGDYRVEVSIRTPDDDGIGLLFRYRHPRNYYKLDLDRQRGFRKLFKMSDGVETELASTAGGHEMDNDMLLEVTVTAGQIEAQLDGALIFGAPIADPAPLRSGTIALYSWGSMGVSFDDVSVELSAVDDG
jgi:hypothetical protein